MRSSQCRRIRRNLGFGALALLFAASVIGCRPERPDADDGSTAAVIFDPNPPTVGKTGVTILLAEGDSKPVRLGHLKVEGNMNHAGMSPVFTSLEETEPGRYAGTIEFTMGGDWFLLLTGERPDGSRLEKKIDVPGVRASM